MMPNIFMGRAWMKLPLESRPGNRQRLFSAKATGQRI
jgi:hypothetical protein